MCFESGERVSAFTRATLGLFRMQAYLLEVKVFLREKNSNNHRGLTDKLMFAVQLTFLDKVVLVARPDEFLAPKSFFEDQKELTRSRGAYQ